MNESKILQSTWGFESTSGTPGSSPGEFTIFSGTERIASISHYNMGKRNDAIERCNLICDSVNHHAALLAIYEAARDVCNSHRDHEEPCNCLDCALYDAITTFTRLTENK